MECVDQLGVAHFEYSPFELVIGQVQHEQGQFGSAASRGPELGADYVPAEMGSDSAPARIALTGVGSDSA